MTMTKGESNTRTDHRLAAEDKADSGEFFSYWGAGGSDSSASSYSSNPPPGLRPAEDESGEGSYSEKEEESSLLLPNPNEAGVGQQRLSAQLLSKLDGAPLSAPSSSQSPPQKQLSCSTLTASDGGHNRRLNDDETDHLAHLLSIGREGSLRRANSFTSSRNESVDGGECDHVAAMLQRGYSNEGKMVKVENSVAGSVAEIENWKPVLEATKEEVEPLTPYRMEGEGDTSSDESTTDESTTDEEDDDTSREEREEDKYRTAQTAPTAQPLQQPPTSTQPTASKAVMFLEEEDSIEDEDDLSQSEHSREEPHLATQSDTLFEPFPHEKQQQHHDDDDDESEESSEDDREPPKRNETQPQPKTVTFFEVEEDSLEEEFSDENYSEPDDDDYVNHHRENRTPTSDGSFQNSTIPTTATNADVVPQNEEESPLESENEQTISKKQQNITLFDDDHDDDYSGDDEEDEEDRDPSKKENLHDPTSPSFLRNQQPFQANLQRHDDSLSEEESDEDHPEQDWNRHEQLLEPNQPPDTLMQQHDDQSSSEDDSEPDAANQAEQIQTSAAIPSLPSEQDIRNHPKLSKEESLEELEHDELSDDDTLDQLDQEQTSIPVPVPTQNDTPTLMKAEHESDVSDEENDASSTEENHPISSNQPHPHLTQSHQNHDDDLSDDDLSDDEDLKALNEDNTSIDKETTSLESDASKDESRDNDLISTPTNPLQPIEVVDEGDFSEEEESVQPLNREDMPSQQPVPVLFGMPNDSHHPDAENVPTNQPSHERLESDQEGEDDVKVGSTAVLTASLHKQSYDAYYDTDDDDQQQQHSRTLSTSSLQSEQSGMADYTPVTTSIPTDAEEPSATPAPDDESLRGSAKTYSEDEEEDESFLSHDESSKQSLENKPLMTDIELGGSDKVIQVDRAVTSESNDGYDLVEGDDDDDDDDEDDNDNDNKEETSELKEKRQQRMKRNRIMMFALVIVLILAGTAVTLFFLVFKDKSEKQPKPGATNSPTSSPTIKSTTDRNEPNNGDKTPPPSTAAPSQSPSNYISTLLNAPPYINLSSGNSISMSSDGSIIAISTDIAVQLYSFDQDNKQYQPTHFLPIEQQSNIALSQNGDRLAVGFGDYILQVYQLSQEEQSIITQSHTVRNINEPHMRLRKRFRPRTTDIPPTWDQLTNITFDSFFNNTSLQISPDGNRIVIATSQNEGSVTLLEYNSTGGPWDEVKTLQGQTNNGFGTSVALSEQTLAIGSNSADAFGDGSGLVDVYDISSDDFTQLGEPIPGDNENDQSGTSISLSRDGNTLAIGSIGASSSSTNAIPNAGNCRIFRYNNTQQIYQKIGSRLEGSKENEYFGTAVVLSENGLRVAIANALGEVAVYNQTSDDEWIIILKVGGEGEQADNDGTPMKFGKGMSLNNDGSKLVVGDEMSGKVYVYDILK